MYRVYEYTSLQGLQGLQVLQVLQGLTERNEVRDLQARQVEMSRSASHSRMSYSQCPKNKLLRQEKGTASRNKVHGVAKEEERRAAGVGDLHVFCLRP